ncbi:hypothetical protein D1007_25583 [Hordeum vulgare]|nr:hypothetical protein D1007_25583 [Hordeum vulgare]
MRMPVDERVLELRVRERVVFGTLFTISFGLPARCFIRKFLEFNGLEMHHLGPNSVLYIACFAMLCEGYLGFRPFSSLFWLFFQFHTQKNEEVSYSCGGAVVYASRNALFPHMKLIDSFMKCQRSFFYIRSIGEGPDWVNLSPFTEEPLTYTNWDLEECNNKVMGWMK